MSLNFVNNEPGTITILSTIQKNLLLFFNMEQANSLRLISKEFEDTVKEYEWKDYSTVVYRKTFEKWRTCFPNAKAANIYGITDKIAESLKGIHTLIIVHKNEITDIGFAYLEGIQTLDINCSDITDKAFVHLKGIKSLTISNCKQITNNAFLHLKGIKDITIMNGCNQISNDAFIHLDGCKVNTLVPVLLKN